MNNMAMFLLGASLAFGLCISSYVLSGAIKSVRQDMGIKVKGYSEQEIKADIANWDIEIYSRDSDAKHAYIKVENDVKTVLEKLMGIGFADREITKNAALLIEERANDQKGNATNKIEFYKVIQTISVETSNVSLVNGSGNAITELIKAGISLRSMPPSYTYSRLEALKLDLLGKASENAYNRARIIVGRSNGKIGSIKSASQGVFQIVPKNSTSVSDSGAYDTSTIDKTMKGVITVEYDVVK